MVESSSTQKKTRAVIENNNNDGSHEGEKPTISIVRESSSDFDILDVVRARASNTVSETKKYVAVNNHMGSSPTTSTGSKKATLPDDDDMKKKKSTSSDPCKLERKNGGNHHSKSQTTTNNNNTEVTTSTTTNLCSTSTPVVDNDQQQQSSKEEEEEFDIMKVVQKRAAIMGYHQTTDNSNKTTTTTPTHKKTTSAQADDRKAVVVDSSQQQPFDVMDIVQKRARIANNEEEEQDVNSQHHQQQQPQQRVSDTSLPGAYSEAPGQPLHLQRHISYSLVGVVQPHANDDEEEGRPNNFTTTIGHMDQHQEEEEEDEHNDSSTRSPSHYGPSIEIPEPATTSADNDYTGSSISIGFDDDDFPQQQQVSFAGDGGDGDGDLVLARATPVFSQRIRTFVLARATPVFSQQRIRTTRAGEIMDASILSSQSRNEIDKRYKRRFILFLIICILVSAGTIIFAVVYKNIRGTTREEVEPTMAPTQPPSSAPTGMLDTFLDNLPEYTLESLKNTSSPQWFAKTWLEEHPDLLTMEEWRKRQLFALATFFMAMEGSKWPEPIRDNWLLYDKSECFWFANAFGRFDSTTGEWVPFHYYKNSVVEEPCNSQDEFQLLDLFELELSGLHPFLPAEMSLLTSLSALVLSSLNSSVHITEFLPHHQIFQMTNLKYLYLHNILLSGPLPSEMGLATSMINLGLDANDLTGQIPSEVGLMAPIEYLGLSTNNLTGRLPSEMGLLTSTVTLSLYENSLTGLLPSELGLMTNLTLLPLHRNSFSGQLPSELCLLTNMEALLLHQNTFTGSVPVELGMMSNLHSIRLDNNSLTGTIPEPLCSLGVYSPAYELGLSFDCSEELCGCCWCPCSDSNYNDTECQVLPPKLLELSSEDEEWPGIFPTPVNSSNTITINVKTDSFPAETTWDWSVLSDLGMWEVLDSQRFLESKSLHSHTLEVVPDTLYKLELFDSWGDGTCCLVGFGWFTITSSIPSQHHPEGTVIWEALGYELMSSLEIFIWIDQHGNAQHVEYLPGEGFALSGDESRTVTVVVSDSVLRPSNASGVESDVGDA